MRRFKHWLKPTPKKVWTAILLAVAVTGGAFYSARKPALPPPPDPVQVHLSQAEAQSAKALDKRIDSVRHVFRQGRAGANRFASDALSWSGKWALVRSKLGDGDAHSSYLAASFAANVFTEKDVQWAVESAISGYILDLDAAEAELLVKLRADLADRDPEARPYLRTDEAFQREYRRLALETTQTLETDLKVTVGREVGLMIGSDLATKIAMRIAAFVAAELGVEAGLLGAGAASGTATLGVGLVVAVVLDYALDALFKLGGYDPEKQIADKVKASIEQVEAALVDGKQGLRYELSNIHEERAKLRRAVVAKLVGEGGGK